MNVKQFSVLILLLLLSACGSPEAGGPAKEVETVEVYPSSATLRVGESIVLEATVDPSDAIYGALVWESPDEKVAKVDAVGRVTATGRGEVTIKVTAGKKSTGCAVVVYEGFDAKNDSFNEETID